MKSRLRIGLITLMMSLLSISVSAQKHIDDYNPEALFNEGVLLFQNQEYGAALSTFMQYRALANDAKSQRCVDAQYYEAVSAMYLGQADGPAKVVQFVNDNPGSTWAKHANFLYANNLFQEKKYKEALAIYVATDATSLSKDEAQQMQFNMGYAYFQSGELDKSMPLFHGLMMKENIKTKRDIIMLISNMLKSDTMRPWRTSAACARIPIMPKWCRLTSCKSTI